MTKTKASKLLGIYMDCSNAYLMELIDKKIVSRNIEFESRNESAEVSTNKYSDSTFNDEKQQLQAAYYLEISEIIRNYNQVLLFGPAQIKNQLFSLLEFDHNFDHIKIKNVNTDKMTENQIHTFLKEYYN